MRIVKEKWVQGAPISEFATIFGRQKTIKKRLKEIHSSDLQGLGEELRSFRACFSKFMRFWLWILMI